MHLAAMKRGTSINIMHISLHVNGIFHRKVYDYYNIEKVSFKQQQNLLSQLKLSYSSLLCQEFQESHESHES